jgi:2-keto-4-pentenoate hydratase/2-oxohepta-3-ene-1,7-dioic acid hydratase in catechol pathway
MRLVRFRQDRQQPPRWGWVRDDLVGALDGSPFSLFRREAPTLPIDRVELLAPVEPSKVICIGRNYAAHAAEHQAEVPDLPLIFLKPPSAVIGHRQTIRLPAQSERVEHEAELAVVIGEAGRWIAAEAADRHILGYTIANDVTARDLQERDGQWTRAKGFDTFCPLGPWIETEFAPADALITCSVNGHMRQMASTRDLVFPVRQLVAFISSVMSLSPGDVILTGTPAGVGPLTDGDEVEIEIENLGRLSNPVRAEARPA